MVVNGVMFRTRTGCPWRDLPGEYGNWKAAYNRHRRWSLDGTWQKILDRLRAGCDEAEGPDWTLSADRPGIAPRIELLLPIGVRARQLAVRA